MRNKSAFFTIVTKSYFPLAEVLHSSIESHNVLQNDIDNIIVIIDGDADFVLKYCEREKYKIFCGEDFYQNELELFRSLSFKYDITEFCTSIKPRVFEYFINENIYDKIFYFDPDICIYDDLSLIISTLEGYLFALTPHCLSPALNEKIFKKLLGSGIYNLGFLGVSGNSRVLPFISFWKDKCEKYCFRESSENLFTDQKWIDLITGFYPVNEINIIRNFAFNVAPWNSFERKIISNHNTFEILYNESRNRLCFYHFSGFDYSNIKLRSNEKFEVIGDDDLVFLLEDYKIRLQYCKIDRFINLKCNFGYFSNGNDINKIHRRLYRNMMESGILSLKDDPFKNEKLLKIHSSLKLVDSKNDISSIKEYSILQKIIEFLAILLRKSIGWKNYLLLLKYLKYFSKYENQLFQIK